MAYMSQVSRKANGWPLENTTFFVIQDACLEANIRTLDPNLFVVDAVTGIRDCSVDYKAFVRQISPKCLSLCANNTKHIALVCLGWYPKAEIICESLGARKVGFALHEWWVALWVVSKCYRDFKAVGVAWNHGNIQTMSLISIVFEYPKKDLERGHFTPNLNFILCLRQVLEKAIHKHTRAVPKS